MEGRFYARISPQVLDKIAESLTLHGKQWDSEQLRNAVANMAAATNKWQKIADKLREIASKR